MQDRFNYLSDFFIEHKRKVIVIGVGVVLCLVLVLMLTLQPSSTKPQPSATNNVTSGKNDTTVMPAVQGGSYDLKQATISSTAKTVASYLLKTNFTDQDLNSFGTMVNMNKMQSNNANNAVFTSSDKGSIGYALFNKQTGAFEVTSYGEIKPKAYNVGMRVQEEAKAYLAELGVGDSSVSCQITYTKKPFNGTNGYTFVECHRDWQLLGLPDYQALGLLNTLSSEPLSQFQEGAVSSDSPDDNSIIAVNGSPDDANAVGKARPDDFNSATVAIDKAGNIREVSSNLRWIQSKSIIQPVNLISSQQAVTMFNQHKAQYSLVVPEGDGSLDWNQVFPQQKADLADITVTDITLSYLEQPPALKQSQLVPMYILRGYGSLQNGYRVSVIEFLPALKDASSIFAQTNGTDASFPLVQKAYAADSLQLGTFTPTIGPTTTPVNKPACQNANLNGTSTITIPEYGTVIRGSDPHTFYLAFRSTEDTDAEKAKAREAIYNAVQQQYIINVAKYIQQQQVAVSQDNIGQLYNAINKVSQNNCSTEVFGINSGAPAPIHDCTPQSGGGGDALESAVMEQVYTAVTNKILADNADGSLSNDASQSDLFPSSVNTNLQWVFMNFNHTGGYYASDSYRPGASCYITGSSPSLFLYPEQKENIAATVSVKATYMDPASQNNTWNVQADQNGMIQNKGQLFSYLYYEYDRQQVRFNEPNAGYIVPMQTWKQTVQSIAKKLALTNSETTQLVHEVANTLNGKKAAYLKISMIDPKELTVQLPLTIVPRPDNVYRINLMLTLLSKSQQATPPNLAPVTRTGFTAVELGAYLR